MHEVFKTFGGPHSSGIWKVGMPALINFQFHIIARIDNTTQVIMDHICVHNHFENALKLRLTWSKHVQDERDAPWQIVLGSIDPIFCVIISLELWLECNRNGLTLCFAFSDKITVRGGGQKAKLSPEVFWKSFHSQVCLHSRLSMRNL